MGAPDLSRGSPWKQQRIHNLKAAVKGRPDAHTLFAEELQALDVHHKIYGPEGPRRLQLLWWEFPTEHRDFIREGCRLNFLSVPGRDLVDNAPLDAEKQATAVQFVEEIISLGVLLPLPDGVALKANGPLFLVENMGQPGEWQACPPCGPTRHQVRIV